MAIEIRAHFFRLARTGVGLLMGALLMCGVAGAAAPPAITTESVVPIPYDTSWGQVYKILFYDGNVLALDAGNGALFQLAPGAPSWSTLVPKSGIFGGGYNAVGMTIDAVGTLYIGARYPGNCTFTQTGSVFYRVPYDPVAKTWNVNSGDGWGSTIVDNVNFLPLLGEDDLVFVDSALKDGSGTLYWMADSPYDIYSLPVTAKGNTDVPAPTAISIIDGLVANQGKIAVDVNGNIYFTENRAVTSPTARAPGLFFIPAGVNGISGPSGTVEQQILRIDTPTNPVVYGGPTLDAAGNVYLSSEKNATYFETTNGVWMIPNECGGPTKVSATCLPNFAHISLLATFGPNQALSIDSRGFLWLPTYEHPSADGSGPITDAYAITVIAPGSLNLGASPTVPPGPVGPGSTVWVNFNGVTEPDGSIQPVTLGAYQFSQPGTGSDFLEAAADPNPPSTPPTTPYECIATTQYAVQTSCEYWVELSARAPGAISGQLLINGVDNNNNPVSSTVYLSGIGQGAEAAILDSPAQTAIAAEPQLNTPAQVAADPIGDTWVADPGLHQVLRFSAGSSIAPGTPVGSWSSPTGVAVDGSGDLYIADSHKVFEIPATNGVPVLANQTPIASGLGDHLNLAVDGFGDVYVADADNAQVVMISRPAATNLIPVFSPTTVTVGSGYTAPSAVAVDSSGDVFVADGTNLWEITPFPGNVMNSITTKLNSPVTGLAVDASGSVIVSQSGGILRIPLLTTGTGSSLSFNDAISLDPTFTAPNGVVSPVTAPNGVALDQQGNLYVSDMTGGTPNLYEFAVLGAVNFGDALSPQDQATAEVALFDIGNEPLTVTGGPAFSGTGFDLTTLAALTGGTCDTTGATPVAAGTSCTVEVGFTPPAKGSYSGDSMTVPTNAGNVAGGNITATLSGTALNDLVPTTTAITNLNPSSSTYLGSTAVNTTVTVTVTPAPTVAIPANGNTPSGTVTLTLTNTVTLATITPPSQQASGNATAATATFTVSGLLGGTYCVTAAYAGNTTALYKPSSSPDCSTSAGTTFAVAQAPPAITLSEPSGITPNSNNNIYYVKDQETTTTITANVSSTLGSPQGTITFMNGTNVLGSPVALDGFGNAVFDPGALGQADGSYNLTAVYSGDQNFAPVTSSVIAYQVIPPSVLITANPASLSTAAGTPVASTLSLQSLAGYAAALGANISCDPTTLPYYSECTFNVPQPIICAPPGSASTPCSGVTTTVVTISSNIPVNLPPSTTASVREHRSGSSPLIPAGIFGLGLFGLAMRRRAVFSRKLLSGAALGLMLFGVVMGFGGCSNNSYTKSIVVQKYTTAAGTYNVSIQVTNVSSGAVQSLPFTIPVTIQ
jgi:sugar lactone lactonase YvrE